MKIKVKPEGRDGIWMPEKDSLIDFLINYEFDEIHNIVPSNALILGADHSKESVIEDVKSAEGLALLTGDSYLHNMKHALSVITGNKLSMFDIGEFNESDFEISEPATNE